MMTADEVCSTQLPHVWHYLLDGGRCCVLIIHGILGPCRRGIHQQQGGRLFLIIIYNNLLVLQILQQDVLCSG